VFRGTRTPVSVIFENIEDTTVDELIQEFAGTDTRGFSFAAPSTALPRS
jgi:hypothetical protein